MSTIHWDLWHKPQHIRRPSGKPKKKPETKRKAWSNSFSSISNNSIEEIEFIPENGKILSILDSDLANECFAFGAKGKVLWGMKVIRGEWVFPHPKLYHDSS
jgi:hypothetical protein